MITAAGRLTNIRDLSHSVMPGLYFFNADVIFFFWFVLIKGKTSKVARSPATRAPPHPSYPIVVAGPTSN